MKKSFIWFVGLVSVLLVGTFFATLSDQTEKNDEIQTATVPLVDEQSNYTLEFSPTALNLKESLAAMESTLP